MINNEFYELVNKSNITTLGYSFIDERLKDELISQISYIDVGKIDSSFSIKSFIRDIKLNKILNNDFSFEKITHILFDTNNIKTGSTLKERIERRRFFSFLKTSEYDENIKIIITSSTIDNVLAYPDTLVPRLESELLYISDLVMVICENKKHKSLKIEKNRLGIYTQNKFLKIEHDSK
jgi:hypothetical protein